MVVRVTVTLPEELLGKLDAIAAEESVTRSDVVREAAGSYVARRAQGAEASARRTAVDAGLAWLTDVAAIPSRESAGTLEILRDIRGTAVAPLESDR